MSESSNFTGLFYVPERMFTCSYQYANGTLRWWWFRDRGMCMFLFVLCASHVKSNKHDE